MYRNIVLLALMLVAFLPFVQPAEDDAVSQANRFLSAEVQRQIQDAKEDMLKQMQDFEDENFRLLDERMHVLMTDIRMKVVLGAIGAALVANAIIALVLVRTMKTYSYENYQSKLLQGQAPAAAQPVSAGYEQGLEPMQKPQWQVQDPQPTMATRYGQEYASERTQMNQWQAQPAYEGAWQAPVQAKPEYSHMPAGYEHTETNRVEDPMQSPGWSPQGGA